MNSRSTFLGAGWARGGSSELVRRAHPASGAEWNVQVVRGKVNGKCLWNACKALSLGLLLMILGAAMATIGYYADHLSMAQEVRGNHTVRVKNESRGFHLNNLSYAGPIIMGVGGFIVVAACVMTFEARDSAAKVVPARFKLSATGPPPNLYHGSYSGHGSLRTSGSQTGANSHCGYSKTTTDRRALTQSFMHFSRGLALESNIPNKVLLKSPQGSINRSPSAPDLVLERGSNEQSPLNLNSKQIKAPSITKTATSTRRTFAACALLNPGLLHRHAMSMDEGAAAGYKMSHESLQTAGGSQGSMAMDLHLECPVTLRVRDKRRNPLKRQRRVDEEEKEKIDNSSRRSSHSCSPRINSKDCSLGSTRRRSSNASDCTHRSRSRRRDCPHVKNGGRLERAISSDSRLTGAIPKCHHHHHHHQNTPNQNSTEQEQDPPLPIGSSSDTDIHQTRHQQQHHAVVHFSPEL